MVVANGKDYWSLHTHTVHSVNDALASVTGCVARAVELGYPALAVTDHRNVSASVQLYKASRKAGIEPLPGIELDVLADTEQMVRTGKMHLTVVAYNERGYRNLVKLSTLANQKFWYLPRIDFADLAKFAEDDMTQGLLVATGCLGGVLPQTWLRTGGDHAAAVHVAKTLSGWFPKVYIELQSHGIDIAEYPGVTDDDVLQAMWDVAQETGIQPVVTEDSHYIHAEERPLHDALKQLVAFSEDPDDATFNGERYHMVTAEEMQPYFPRKMLEAGIDGLREIAEAAYVRLPELETFTLKVPRVSFAGDDPQATLERMVHERLTEEEKADHATMKWLRDELDVWRSSGMATYALVVYGVCNFMREKKIRFAARGSASGSFVLYKLGVTQIHPIKMKLRFDRFLSTNRLKPPDVDLDVEHTRRDEVVDYISTLYYVRPVGNQGKYSIYAEEGLEEEHSRGSLRERYFTVMRKRGVKDIEWRMVPKADKDMLYALSDMKLIKGYGKHAAGYILAPNKEVLDQLPLARTPSNPDLVTAYGKKDVEALGFLKLDLLGLKTQTAMRNMEELTGIDFDDIPDEDLPTYRMISGGNTSGVFQLDGFTMSKGCKDLKPQNLEDLIAAQALYRPAPMHAGWTRDYLKRRAGRQAIPKRHDDIMSATEDTFGILLYQEQVMDVVRNLGFDQAGMESMLDAVKASNEYSLGAAEALKGMMPQIRDLARDRHWAQVDIDWLVEGLANYAEYSFNRAHAAAYGLLAYRTAWMKFHQKLEFWCAILMAYEDSDAKVVRKKSMQARQDGIGMLPPHVNHSKATYTVDREANRIRRGLVSVKYVGQGSALEIAAKAPFTDLTDMGERLTTKITGAKNLALKKHPLECGGMISHLYDADALEGLAHRS